MDHPVAVQAPYRDSYDDPRRSTDRTGRQGLLLEGSANRDEAVFADPMSFDIARDPEPSPRLRPRRALLPRREPGPPRDRGAVRGAAGACRGVPPRGTGRADVQQPPQRHPPADGRHHPGLTVNERSTTMGTIGVIGTGAIGAGDGAAPARRGTRGDRLRRTERRHRAVEAGALCRRSARWRNAAVSCARHCPGPPRSRRSPRSGTRRRRRAIPRHRPQHRVGRQRAPCGGRGRSTWAAVPRRARSLGRHRWVSTPAPSWCSRAARLTR